MIKVFRRIWQELFSQHNYGFNGKIIIVLTLLIASSMFSQPPPPCEANGNSGFGGAVGEGHFLFTGEFSNPIIFAMTTSGNEINDIFVLYYRYRCPWAQ